MISETRKLLLNFSFKGRISKLIRLTPITSSEARGLRTLGQPTISTKKDHERGQLNLQLKRSERQKEHFEFTRIVLFDKLSIKFLSFFQYLKCFRYRTSREGLKVFGLNIRKYFFSTCSPASEFFILAIISNAKFDGGSILLFRFKICRLFPRRF